MKKIILLLLLPMFIISCNNETKENDLLKKENDLLKKEIELQKKEKEITNNSKKELKNNIPSDILDKINKIKETYIRKENNIKELISSFDNNKFQNDINELKVLLSEFEKEVLIIEDTNNNSISNIEKIENQIDFILDKIINETNNKDSKILTLIGQIEGTNNRLYVLKKRYNDLIIKYPNNKYPKFYLEKKKEIKVEF